MDPTSIISRNILSLNSNLEYLTTHINSSTLIEAMAPKVEDLELTLIKIEKLIHIWKLQSHFTNKDHPTLAKLKELEDGYKRLYSWSFDREVNALDQENLKYINIVKHTLNEMRFTEAKNSQKDLFTLVGRLEVLSKQTHNNENQTQRLKQIHENLIESSLFLAKQMKNQEELIQLHHEFIELIPHNFEKAKKIFENLSNDLQLLICRALFASLNPQKTQVDHLAKFCLEHFPQEDIVKALQINLQNLACEKTEVKPFTNQNSPSLEDIFPDEILSKIFCKLPIRDLANVSECSKYLYNLTKDTKNIDLYRIKNLEQSFKNGYYFEKTLKGHENGVVNFRVVDDLLISGFQDGSIKVYNLKTHELIELPGIKHFTHVDVSSNYQVKGNFLFTASNNNIHIYDLYTKNYVKTLKGHKKWISQIEIKDNFLYSSSFDSTIRIWDLDKGKCVSVLQGPKDSLETGPVEGFQIVDDYIYSLSRGKWTYYPRPYHYPITHYPNIKVWNLKDSQCVRTAHIPGALYQFVPWSLKRVGNYLYLGFSNGLIQFWDPKSMQVKRDISKAHHGAVSCLQHTDQFLFSASWDYTKKNLATVKIWKMDKKILCVDNFIAKKIEELRETPGKGFFLSLEDENSTNAKRRRDLNALAKFCNLTSDQNSELSHLKFKPFYILSHLITLPFENGTRNIGFRNNCLYAASKGKITVFDFSENELHFLSKLPHEDSILFQRLPFHIQADISEEIGLFLLVKSNWYSCTTEEKILVVNRYLLKKVLEMLKYEKRRKAFNTFSLLPEDLKINLLKEAEGIFSSKLLVDAIQNYLK